MPFSSQVLQQTPISISLEQSHQVQKEINRSINDFYNRVLDLKNLNTSSENVKNYYENLIQNKEQKIGEEVSKAMTTDTNLLPILTKYIQALAIDINNPPLVVLSEEEIKILLNGIDPSLVQKFIEGKEVLASYARTDTQKIKQKKQAFVFLGVVAIGLGIYYLNRK